MSVILAPDGTAARVPVAVDLTRQDAAALWAYKALLKRYNYVHGDIFCERCQVDSDGSVSLTDVAKLIIGDEKIGIACNCRLLHFNGRT